MKSKSESVELPRSILEILISGLASATSYRHNTDGPVIGNDIDSYSVTLGKNGELFVNIKVKQYNAESPEIFSLNEIAFSGKT